VNDDVYSAFRRENFPERIFRKTKDRTFLDIREANKTMLDSEGLKKIHDTGLCTYCSKGLFASYRKGEKNSRQINFVSLKG
jgi:copper oxidase (laccase) domain-containing protein